MSQTIEFWIKQTEIRESALKIAESENRRTGSGNDNYKTQRLAESRNRMNGMRYNGCTIKRRQ